MKKIYFTYRRTYTDRGVRQDVSFYNDKMFADFKEAGLTKMTDGDNFIPEQSITKEIIPGVPSLRRAGVLEVSINVPLEQIKADLLKTSQSFLLEIKTKDEMLEWIRTNTNLVEKTTGVFIKGNTEEGEEILLTID